MPRIKRFIDMDVIEAARQRIRRTYEICDSLAVCFSGGKDSLVCLHLCRQEAEKLGRLPVDVIFYDEEIIPNDVIDFVESYRTIDWVRMRWFAYPLESEKVVLQKRVRYVQWDPGRKWVRQPPTHALRLAEGDSRILSQYTLDDISVDGLPGKVALVTGIRASESLVRYRSIVNILHDSYIANSRGSRICKCRPIYDWTENDVMKWLHENEIRWCPVYDQQHLVGQALRVSTPLHSESSRQYFGRRFLRRTQPDFYERIIAIFPDMAIQERYVKELDRDAIGRDYDDGTLESCERFIDEQIDDHEQRTMAFARLREFRMLGSSKPEAYPPAYLLKCLISGSIKRTILPVPRVEQHKYRRPHDAI